MNVDRLRELWTRYLCGEPLLVEDERALLDALRADPALRESLLDEAEVDALLRSLPAGDAGDDFARAFLERVKAEGDSDRFVGSVERRMGRSRRRRRAAGRGGVPWIWLGALAAASLLILLPLLMRKVPTRPLPAGRPEAALPAPEPEPPTPPAPVPKALVAELPAPPPPFVPAPPPVPKPAVEPPAPPVPAPPAPSRTRTSIARVERLAGEVFLLAGTGRTPVRPEEGIEAGEGIETSGERSGVALRFADGTLLELGPGSVLRDLQPKQGLGAGLVQGTVAIRAARQPAGHAVVISTPNAEARVLGTAFTMSYDPSGKGSTRLDVTEGKVRLRRADGKGVDVEAGYVAVAAAGTDLVARSKAGRALLRWDFEGSALPAGWETGKLTAGPAPAGSRGCLQSQVADGFRTAALSLMGAPSLPRTTERLRIRFRCWLGEPGEAWVQVFSETTRSNYKLVLPDLAAGRWETVDVPFTKLARWADQVPLGAADVVRGLSICQERGSAPFYVDDVEIVEGP